MKDFAAAVRLLDNPADELAWFRLLRMHDGIGPARGRMLLGLLAPWAGTSAPRVGRGRRRGPGEVAGRPQRTPWRASTPPAGRPAPPTRVTAVFRLLRPLVLSRYSRGPGEARGPRPAVGRRGRRWTTCPPGWPRSPSTRRCRPGTCAGPPHLDEDYVVISTVHSAKGLEWPSVHLPHLVDGAFPSDMALGSADGLAEERRLFYVATTRAKDRLTLYTPLRMPYHRRARDDRHSSGAGEPVSRRRGAGRCSTSKSRPRRVPTPRLRLSLGPSDRGRSRPPLALSLRLRIRPLACVSSLLASGRIGP